MQIINKIKIVFLLVNFQGRIIKDLFYLKKKSWQLNSYKQAKFEENTTVWEHPLILYKWQLRMKWL